MLKALLRVLAIVILALFVIAFPLSLVMRDIGALIFDPSTTKSLVRDHLLDAELIASLAKQASRELLSGGTSDQASSGASSAINEALSHLTDEDWQKITDLTAPTALVEETVNELVDAYTVWLNGGQTVPSLQLDLTVWKANTEANAGAVMGVVLDALPDCNASELLSMTIEGLQSAEGIVSSLRACKPPEPFYGTLIANADLLLAASLRQAPDSINLNPNANNATAPKELQEFKASLTQVRTALSWTWLIVAGLGLLAVAMTARGLKAILRWSGWPLVLSGTFTLIFGLGLQLFSLQFLDNLLAGPLAEQSGAVGALGRAIAGGALDLVSKPLLLQGLLLTTLGIGALFYARILSRKVASPGIPLNQKRIGL